MKTLLASISRAHPITWLIDILCLSLVLGFFYFIHLGDYSLFSPDEARYAEAAREMLSTGNLITPTVNGVVFLDKPILHYWLQVIAITLWGVQEWSIRFFPATIAVLGCLACYLAGRNLFDRSTGICSAIILATSPLYFGGGHYANLDLEIAVLISLSLLSFIIAINQSSHLRFILLLFTYIFAGLAFLTKGLIGFTFPFLIISTWIIISRQWHQFQQLNFTKGSLLFLLLVMPWFILAEITTPGFWRYFFLEQQVSRFLSQNNFNNASPFWFYLPIFLAGFFPWSLFLIYSGLKTIRDNKKSTINPTILFLLVWIVIVFGFFSIPQSKPVTYILPMFPACALLTGYFFSKLWQKIPLIFIILSFTMSSLLIYSLLKAEHLNPRNTKILTKKLKSIIQPDDIVIHYYKYFPDNPFYLQRTIYVVYDWHSPKIAMIDNWARELWIGSHFQTENKTLIDNTTFHQYWFSAKRVYILLSDNFLPQWLSEIKQYYVIDKVQHKLLLSNQPRA